VGVQELHAEPGAAQEAQWPGGLVWQAGAQ